VRLPSGSYRGTFIVVAATIVFTIGVLSATIDSRASIGSSSASTSPGIYVTGVGRVFDRSGDSAVFVDRQHRLHAVKTVLGDHESYPRALAYYVRDLRTGRATRHTLQLDSQSPWSPISVLSRDGTRINTVVRECQGVATSSTPVAARRLRPLVDANVGPFLCDDRDDTTVLAVDNLEGRRMAIVTASDQGPAPDEGNTLFVGVPGHQFHIAATDLPGSADGYFLVRLLGHRLGHLTALLDKPMGDRDRGFGLYFSRELSDGSWSNPQLAVRSIPPTGAHERDSLSAPPVRGPDGKYYFPIERARIHGGLSSSRPRYAIAVVGGTASASRPLPNTKGGDFSLSFAAVRGRIYAAFIRRRDVSGGWVYGRPKEELLGGSAWRQVKLRVSSAHVSVVYLAPAPLKPRIAYIIGPPIQ
jgi:hypothetical protein